MYVLLSFSNYTSCSPRTAAFPRWPPLLASLLTFLISLQICKRNCQSSSHLPFRPHSSWALIEATEQSLGDCTRIFDCHLPDNTCSARWKPINVRARKLEHITAAWFAIETTICWNCCFLFRESKLSCLRRKTTDRWGHHAWGLRTQADIIGRGI